MPELLAREVFAPDGVDGPQAALPARLSLAAQLGLSLVFVGLATGLAFAVDHLISAPNLTLIYVLPVIVAATLFGLGPSLLTVVCGVAAYDFFFTAPYYSLAIDDPAEIWAAVLLLLIATVVASVSATSRRRAVAATEAAEKAEALQTLAHVAIGSPAQGEVLQAAATALHRLFHAPAIIFLQRDGAPDAVATAGGAEVKQADEEAARGALSSRLNTRGETYPYDRTYFDFWPVSTPAGDRCALGVDFVHSPRDRPASPEKLIESVAGYVAAALVRGRPVPPSGPGA